MKRHGNYTLPTAEELLRDCGVGGCTQEYFSKQIKRHKQKYRNDKRHRIKRKKYERRKM